MVTDEKGYQAWKSGTVIPQWIGWPKDDLFDYDEAVYKRLRLMFENGQYSELNEEWSKLRR